MSEQPVRRRAGANSTYALSETERLHVGMLAAMNLWPKAAVAKAYGVHPKTVLMCLRRYEERAT